MALVIADYNGKMIASIHGRPVNTIQEGFNVFIVYFFDSIDAHVSTDIECT